MINKKISSKQANKSLKLGPHASVCRCITRMDFVCGEAHIMHIKVTKQTKNRSSLSISTYQAIYVCMCVYVRISVLNGSSSENARETFIRHILQNNFIKSHK